MVARLKAEEVVRIRERAFAGASLGGGLFHDLAEEYGIGVEQIRRIVLGMSHRDVGGPRLGAKDRRYRLAPEQVQDIKRRLAAGEDYKALARQYKVHAGTIYHIATGENWRNPNKPLPDHDRADGPRKQGRGTRKNFPPDVVIRIREQAAEGRTAQGLADEYKVSAERIRRLVYGLTYPDVGGPRTGRRQPRKPKQPKHGAARATRRQQQ